MLVTDIPPDKLSEQALAKEYSVFGVKSSMVSINRDVESLSVLIEERRRLVLGLEKAIMEFLPSRTGITNKAWKKADSATISSIAAKVHDIDTEITRQQQRPELFKKLPSAFITFQNPNMAHLAQQAIVGSVPLSMISHPVACEADIIWSNLSIGWQQRFARRLITALCVMALAIIWVVPMAMTGLMSQLIYLATKIDWVRNLSDSDKGKVSLGIIQGVIPQLLNALLMALFPGILRALIGRSGQLTKSNQELSVQGHYFTFLYVQVFLVVSISSSIATVLLEVTSDLRSTPAILARNIPKVATTFIHFYFCRRSLNAHSHYVVCLIVCGSEFSNGCGLLRRENDGAT